MSEFNSKLVKVDRSSPWTLEQMQAQNLEFGFKRIWENPQVRLITEIDFHQVILLPLFEGGELPVDVDQENINKSLLDKLAAYQDQGYVLLDGAVVVSLLNNQESLPRQWSQLADAEADSGGADIRFDGSIFKLEGPDEFIIKPFTSRGYWNFGYGERFIKLPSIQDRRTSTLRSAYTAVIRK